MPKPKSVRKPRSVAEPHLKLVPPPKRRRRKRWRIGRIRRPAYHQRIGLHAYEEEVVLATVREAGGRVTVRDLMSAHPDRFNERELWMTLVRLAALERLLTAGGLGLLRAEQFWLYQWHKHKIQRRREFWSK